MKSILVVIGANSEYWYSEKNSFNLKAIIELIALKLIIKIILKNIFLLNQQRNLPQQEVGYH